MAHLFAGTSGFAYPSWKPDFYPEKLPQKSFLNHYASRLSAVEINYTFRRLPNAKTLETWAGQTPAHFKFCVKAHQRITHIQRLQPSEFTEAFFRAIEPLRSSGRLGSVLFQLPPNLKCDTGLLSEFLEILPRDVRLAFEFRHESWLTPEVYSILQQYNTSLCLDAKLEMMTADFVYSRLRESPYTDEQRSGIANRACKILEGGRDVFAFFKHEDSAEGALYAEELIARVGQGGVTP